MKKDEIVIKISKNTNLSDAICKAMNPKTSTCALKNLHQTIKPSLNQDNVDLKNGESAYLNAEWKNQINVMLG